METHFVLGRQPRGETPGLDSQLWLMHHTGKGPFVRLVFQQNRQPLKMMLARADFSALVHLHGSQHGQ